MKKQCKLSVTKNHKTIKNIYFDGVPLKGNVASKVISRFGAKSEKSILGKSSD